MQVSVSQLLLVRHGETTGQSSVRLYGATDIPLSPVGEAQARAVGAALAGGRFDRAVTSPLQRAWRSAALVASAGNFADKSDRFERVEGLREIDFGDWEGWTVEEVARRDPEGHRRWHHDGDHFRFPRGEGRGEFQRRVRAATRASLVAPAQSGARSTLAVLHKGVIKVVIAELTGLDAGEASRLTVNLGSIHRLDFDGHRWRLVEANRVDHLAGPLWMAES